MQWRGGVDVVLASFDSLSFLTTNLTKMRPHSFIYPISIACLLLTSPLSAVDEAINFNRDIRPILSDKCFHCHGPNEKDREEDLRLDIPDGKQGEPFPALY